jgi:hypothetical protein
MEGGSLMILRGPFDVEKRDAGCDSTSPSPCSIVTGAIPQKYKSSLLTVHMYVVVQPRFRHESDMLAPFGTFQRNGTAIHIYVKDSVSLADKPTTRRSKEVRRATQEVVPLERLDERSHDHGHY